MTDAVLANSAIDFPIGYSPMGQLRTTNKRHKRAIAARQTRKEPVEKAKDAASSPEKKA